jgi:hypothetical protein
MLRDNIAFVSKVFELGLKKHSMVKLSIFPPKLAETGV